MIRITLPNKRTVVFSVIVLIYGGWGITQNTAAQSSYHISRNGDDNNIGTLEQPFATLSRARDEVRKRIEIGLDSNITVLIHGGRYDLVEPLILDSRDSGTESFSITYEAYNNESVVISGGRQITGWQKGDGEIWTTPIAEVKDGKWYFRQLFINGHPATRARTPNVNAQVPFFRLASSSLSTNNQNWEMKLASGQIARWRNLQDIELIVIGAYGNARKQIAEVEESTGAILLAGPHMKQVVWANWPRAGMSAYLENARSFLDQPGEWYLDRKTGILAYWPHSEENLVTSEIIAPLVTQLMVITGTPNRLVQNLNFKNLEFRYTEFVPPLLGYMSSQSAFYNPADGQGPKSYHRSECALEFEFVKSCAVVDCRISCLGSSAISLRRGCNNNFVIGNQIRYIGANGIMIGEHNSNPTNKTDAVHKNTIANNSLSGCGQILFGGVAIWIGFAADTVVTHNLVYDLPYSGVSIGWQWDQQPTSCSNTTIADNEIHDVMKVLSDGAGIYTLGSQPGAVLRGNFIHDVTRNSTAVGEPNNGIYFDEGSKGILSEKNVIYKIAGDVLHFNNGGPQLLTFGENYLGDNVFYKGKVGPYSRSFANDRFIDIPHIPIHDPQLLTVEAWIRPLAFAAGNDPSYWLISKNGSELTDGHYSLLMSHNNIGAYLNIGGGRENCYSAWSHGSPLKSNEWSHVAMTYDGATLQVFCDGKLVGKTDVRRQTLDLRPQTIDCRRDTLDPSSQTQDLSSSGSQLSTLDSQPSTNSLKSNVSSLVPRSSGTGTLRIGKRTDGPTPSFAGLMDDVRIYSRALSAEEIRSQTIDYRLKTEDSSAAEGSAPAGLKSQVSSLSSTSQTPSSQPSTNSLQTQDLGLRTQDSSTINSQPSRIAQKSDESGTPSPSQPVSGLPSQVSGLQSSVSSLKSNVFSLTSNLVFHLDFTSMHDHMEKIIAEAGPEEPYRSRFAESERSRASSVESPVTVEKGRELSVESLVPAKKPEAIEKTGNP